MNTTHFLKSKVLMAVTTFAATAMLLANVASAQYYNGSYDNNYYYNYSQPVGVTSFWGGYYPYNINYNDNYNSNYSYQNYPYNNYYNNSYNHNNNCGYSYTTWYNYPCSNNYNNYNYSYNSGYYNNYNYNYSYTNLTPSTYSVTNISSNNATVNGYVNYANTGYAQQGGFAWFQYGTNPSSLNYSTNKASIFSSTSINAHLSGLTCGSTYYYRAVTSGSNGTQYGSTLSFTTAPCYTNYYYPSYQPYYNNYNYYNYNYNNGYWGY